MNFETHIIEFKNKLTTKSINIVYDPNKLTANANEILIGRGEMDNGGLILNNKLPETKNVSVTQMILDTEEAELMSWKQLFSSTEPTLYIEDMSTDTCFSIIVLFARWNGVDVKDIPADWVSYVNRWELGDVKTTGEPRKSWGALLNTLSHEYFFQESGLYNQDKIKTGFYENLSFTIELLKCGANPADVPYLNGSEAYITAITKLNIEYQEYKEIVNNSDKVQLRLPVAGSNRKILVDAIIVTEFNNTGTFKNFARTDQENSFLKSGFGLMAIYSPAQVKEGGEIVISVDPSLGVHLTDLWESLEREEDRKWDKQRPNHNPRPGYTVDQPWYINDTKTLVAAPRLVEIEKGKWVKGAKVTWEESLDILWKLYHPSAELSVHSLKEDGTWGSECNLENCSMLYHDDEKQFMGIKWALNKYNSVLLTPTLQKHLIGLLSGNKKNVILHLPTEESFDFVHFPGGFSLIHQNGVVVFDDWSRDQTNIGSFQKEFLNLLKRYQSIKRFQRRIKDEIESVLEKLQNINKIRGELVALSDNLANIKIELRNDIFSTMPSEEDFHLEEFRKTIEKRWGLNSQLNELYDTVSEIESTLKSMVETRNNKAINGITIYGFPLAVLTSIFSGSLENIFIKQEFNISGIIGFFVLLGLSIQFLKMHINKE